MEEQALIHYGILGMKWGVRRSEAELARARRTKNPADSAERKDRKESVKNRRTLSDAELKRRVERMKLERQYKDLTDEDLAPGKKYVSDILKSAGTKALSTMAAGAAVYAVKVAMTKKFDPKEAAGYIAANPNKKK